MGFSSFILNVYTQYDVIFTCSFCLYIGYSARSMFKKGGDSAAAVPSISISQGIFFTFLGLALSLLAANNSDAQANFSALLSGLSTSFWTSVVGMFTSIHYKKKLVKQDDENPLDDLNHQIHSVRTQIRGLGDDITQGISEKILNAVELSTNLTLDKVSIVNARLDDSISSYVDKIKQLDSTLTRITKDISTSTEGVSNIIEDSEQLAKKNLQHIQTFYEISEKQASLIKFVDASLGSVKTLTPDVKKLFESIEKANIEYEKVPNKVQKIFKDNYEVHDADMKRLLGELVKRIANIDNHHTDIIKTNLEKVDKGISAAFEQMIEEYGAGIIDVTKLQLESIGKAIAGLEAAKKSLSVKEDSHNLVDVSGEV